VGPATEKAWRPVFRRNKTALYRNGGADRAAFRRRGYPTVGLSYTIL